MEADDIPTPNEVIALIRQLCHEDGFPQPDRSLVNAAGDRVTFVWDEHDFTATWDLVQFKRGGPLGWTGRHPDESAAA